MKFPVEETIRRRKSVRSYDGTPLTAEEEKQIDGYIELLTQEEVPFTARVTIKRIKAGDGVDAERLGTYGIIKGTSQFVGVTVENVPGAMEAVGHPAEKRRMFDKVMRRTIGADKRKEWKELFFLNDFQTPISKEDAGAYAYPLEMVRLAPSAVNGQPWRIVKTNGACHFYKAGEVQPDKIYDVQKMDLGIAAAHFELAARERGLSGRFEKVDSVHVNGAEKYEYVFSWIEG